MTEPLRLAKRLAHLLPCSRREAEAYIIGGWVRVDGVVIDQPQYRVDEAQNIELDPNAKLEPQEAVTLLFHLPPGTETALAAQLITPESHAVDDPSRKRVLRSHFARLVAALPLQAGASGLMVYTQDRRVLRKLTDTDYPLEQEYVVEVSGTLIPEGLAVLQSGAKGDACKVSWQSENRLRFALKAPREGQIRALCERLGLQVVAMKRIRIGRLPMAKLPVGQWRYLDVHERF